MLADDEKVAWMRQHGVTSAQWAPSGALIACVLGPVPTPPAPVERDLKTQQTVRPLRASVGGIVKSDY